ncbi:MFS transporter, partial [Acinetobacter baumannii]|nr:MFS transporter [Acinetobacter baumannii]
IAFGLQELGVPFAWIISHFLVSTVIWSVLYSFKPGLALCCLAIVVSLKLSRSLRIDVFDIQDFFTCALLSPGFACLCI